MVYPALQNPTISISVKARAWNGCIADDTVGVVQYKILYEMSQ